jgi:hypothetical protein
MSQVLQPQTVFSVESGPARKLARVFASRSSPRVARLALKKRKFGLGLEFLGRDSFVG